MYKKLRYALVENVYKQWKETGYAWEQYDSVTGKGQRTAHFLGWTSLVVNLMKMPETVSIVPTPPKLKPEAVVEALKEKVVEIIEEKTSTIVDVKDEL